MDKNMLLILGGGAALYWWYTQKKPATAAATGTPGQAPVVPAITPVQQPSAPAAPAASPLKQRIIDAINQSGVSTTFIYGQQSADTWNWYAMQAIPGWTAPSPETLYPGVPKAHDPVSFDSWWSKVQPFLPGGGLSGLRPPSHHFDHVMGGWMA